MTDPLDASTPKPATPAGQRPPAVSGKTADRLSAAVYVAVAVIALVGQSQAAVHWLGWPLLTALPAVAGVELAAVALAARADYRRRKGEAAVAARLLSAGVAAFMTGVNFVGHWTVGQPVAAWFFAGATALGYLVWLLNSADRRRDQMLAEGKVRVAAPDYGMWQWLRQPRVTTRARQLALRAPDLGLYGSLDAATAGLRREQRDRALSRALRRRLRRTVDADAADLAVRTYDLDAIASRVVAGADLDAMAALIAQDLTPERLAASTPADVIDGEVAESPAATSLDDAEPVDAASPDTMSAEVVPMRRPATRRPRPAARRTTTASTPSVEELADTLCRVHCTPGQSAAIGKPTALVTLRQAYGSCSGDRAREAKDVHNRRHASTSDVADDDQESDRVEATA